MIIEYAAEKCLHTQTKLIVNCQLPIVQYLNPHYQQTIKYKLLNS